MTFESWLLFSSIALAATLSPGPAVLLVTSHSLRYGKHRAVFTILGNITGLFVMSLLSVLGVGTLLLYSTAAFNLIKWIGALYLVWLGIGLWRKGLFAGGEGGKPIADCRNISLYRQGLMIALTNPKAIAFTTALFPQFIYTDEPLTSQFLILVITFMLFSFCCLAGYAFLTDSVKTRTSPLLSGKSTGRLFGTVFILAGAALASSSQ